MNSTSGRRYVPHKGKGRNPGSANKSRPYRTETRDSDRRRHSPEGFPVGLLIARHRDRH
jgi:hypothetical protein